MAYIIGLCDEEEIKRLAARGWEVEVPSDAVINAFEVEPENRSRFKLIWLDSSILDLLNCPHCCGVAHHG